tara:strand:- start:72 stop:302 length:231 start_codon:yes stop_codon:yes gene_type:complete
MHAANYRPVALVISKNSNMRAAIASPKNFTMRPTERSSEILICGSLSSSWAFWAFWDWKRLHFVVRANFKIFYLAQ